jgi:hypothetical protein
VGDGQERVAEVPVDEASRPAGAGERPDGREEPRPTAAPTHEGWLSPKGSILLIGGLAIGGIVVMLVTVLVLVLLSLSD